jgi:hypothetical protein
METILEEAARLTSGDRQRDYGHPLDDFTSCGEMWTAMLRRANPTMKTIGPEMVGLMMAASKLNRQCSQPKRDNIVDGCGYLRTVEMVQLEIERRNTFVDDETGVSKTVIEERRTSGVDDRRAAPVGRVQHLLSLRIPAFNPHTDVCRQPTSPYDRRKTR